MKLSLLILLVSLQGYAETWNKNSGFTVGPSGIGATNSDGSPPDVKIENGVISSSFSIFGRPSQSPPESSGPVRVLPVVPAGPSPLTDSNTFFSGVGKKDEEPTGRRRR